MTKKKFKKDFHPKAKETVLKIAVSKNMYNWINESGVKAVEIPLKNGGILGNPLFFEAVMKEKSTSHPAQ